MTTRHTRLLLQAFIFISSAMVKAAPTMEQCDVDLRVYDSTNSCLTGFSDQHTKLYSIIADGECHDSGTEDLGYYVATCSQGYNDWFTLSRSGCTDDTCSDCAEEDPFSGENQEGGCLIDWVVSDMPQSRSTRFAALADGECHNSGIPGLGYYAATCDHEGSWFSMSRSGCTSNCAKCNTIYETDIVSPLRKEHDAKTSSARHNHCTVDAFYKEQVWSVSGSCRRPGCSGSLAPHLQDAKWWPRSKEGDNSVECIYSNAYPQKYQSNEMLNMLFDSREECCDAYARVEACQPMPIPTMGPDVTESDNLKNGGYNTHQQSFLFGFSCFLLLLFNVMM